jgi:hypothetical protein
MCLFKVSQIILDNLIFFFFSKIWLVVCFWKALVKGFSMVYYTLNSVKNSMSCIQMKDSNQQTLYNSTFQMAFNVLALGTKGKYHFDFEFL